MMMVTILLLVVAIVVTIVLTMISSSLGTIIVIVIIVTVVCVGVSVIGVTINHRVFVTCRHWKIFMFIHGKIISIIHQRKYFKPSSPLSHKENIYVYYTEIISSYHGVSWEQGWIRLHYTTLCWLLTYYWLLLVASGLSYRLITTVRPNVSRL